MGAPVHVKICGIMRPVDAFLAVQLGARYLGFVFAPTSPRRIEPGRAAEIIALLPRRVIPVGVFVNAPRDRVLDVIASTGIKMAQFHGYESPEYCTSLGTFPVIKAFRVRPPFDMEDVAPYHIDLCLLDAYDPSAAGGTGRTFDWGLAEPVARHVRVMLAGGLTPENVAEAVQTVRPFAVDVSSGIEAQPGIKDAAKMRAFFESLERAGHLAAPLQEIPT